MDSGSTWKQVTGQTVLPSTRPSPAWIGALPTICAVHCLVAPLLVPALPFLAATHAFEGWLLGASALMAGASLMTSWRLHGRSTVWVLAAVGFVVWTLSVGGQLEPLPEAFMSPLGGMLVAGSLFWNGRLRHQAACGPCACPAHGD